MEIPELSDDILLLICDQVRALDELSSATLFSAAVSTKRLAPLALSNLYRHARSPGTYDEFETGNASEAEQIIMKWAILWRSVYMATAGKSLYPYHTYLRFLDLRDLSNLIDHPHFKRKVEKYFFQGELSQYRARPVQILELFGDSILANNPVVEGVSGSITAEALQRWVPLMPRLRRLELWDGHVLANSQTQEAIYQNCPYFEELSIYSWTGQDTDSQLAPFISGLPQDSLSTLIVIRPCGISEKTVEALNRHGNSLKTLKLDLDPSEGAALGMLRACTSLESLSIQFSGTVDLEASEPDAAKQFSSFLGDCKSLKEVVFTNLKNAPTALVPLLLDEQIPLGDLVMSARTPFFGQHSETFNHALIQKKTLRSLHLQGEAQETTTTQIDGFVETSEFHNRVWNSKSAADSKSITTKLLTAARSAWHHGKLPG